MVTGLPRTLLRLEGVAMAVAALVLYEHVDGSWLLFVLLWIAPDVSAIGYVLGPRVGSVAYDIAHFEAWPIALGLLGLLGDHPRVLQIALIWFSHIGIDRALGYGLKYASNFKDTHLGTMGSRAP
jgi:hypothetical protein